MRYPKKVSPDQSHRLPAGPGLHCEGSLQHLNLHFSSFSFSYFLETIFLHSHICTGIGFRWKRSGCCTGWAVWSQILESLLFRAFCFYSRKRSPAAWLLCDQNWPITNASKGLPLAALAKWFESQALIILRHCCSTLASWQTQRQRGEKGLCFTKLAAAFYICHKRMENRERPKQSW